MLLSSDGSVMVQGGGVSNQWSKLTPDSTGGYVNGTWSSLASMNTARRFYGSDVLNDGRVLVIGGEDSGPNGDRNDTNTAEIYDPLANTWSPVSSFPQAYGGDLPTQTLPDGRVIVGDPLGTDTQIYNPQTGRWSAGPQKLNGEVSNEETWVKLPDGSILSYNITNNPQHAQRFVPSLNSWIDSGSVPLQPTSNTECGPALLLPDGRVFFIGATGQTAFYTPSTTLTGTGSWSLGPTVPDGLGANDAPAAELVNGHVLLVAGGTPGYTPPTEVFDFDPTTNTITRIPTPTAMDLQDQLPSVTRMLDLPSGQVLFNFGTNALYVYTPDGATANSWRPTITSIVSNGGGTYTLTGTQLNGISEGASYGDDAQMATNYPLVEFTDATGVVRFARTFNWSTTAVATGSTLASVQFTLPAGVTSVNRVSVVTNGISSSSVLFIGGSVRTSNDTIDISGQQSAGLPVMSVSYNGISTTWQNVSQVIAAAGNGNDIYNVNSTLLGVPVSIFTGSGNNSINIAANGKDLSLLAGNLAITGSGGINIVSINDQSDSASRTWTIANNSIARSNALPISMSGIQGLNLLGGSGNSVYNILSTNAAAPVSITGGAGSNSFNVTPDSKFVDNLQGTLTLTGGSGNNSLSVNDQSDPYNDTWTVTSTSLFRNAAATVAFSNIQLIALNGGGVAGGVTTYSINGTTPTMAINAGNGPGMLRGPNLDSTWTINGANSGSVGSVSFSGMASLAGGTGNDTFQFGSSGHLSGSIDGGSGTNTLIGAATVNNWNITSGSAGTLNGLAFQFIQNLVGGSSDNTFNFKSKGFVGGTITGGGGNNTLDYSASAFSVYINLQSNVATGVGGGFSNINSFNGNDKPSNTFIGTNATNFWNITGTNSGTLNTRVSFTKFDTLVGGFGADTFAIGAAGNVTGSIFGGGGANVLNAANGSNVWSITAPNAGNLNGIAFSGIQSLTGGSGNDAFVFSPGAFVANAIAGGAGTNSLDFSACGNDIVANLQTGSATAVGGGFTNITSLIGGTGSNILTGTNSTNTWNIAGTNTGNINGAFSFTNFGTLIGGIAVDIFRFADAASVSGTVNGGIGSKGDWLDFSACSTPLIINLTTGTASHTGGINNIMNVHGGNGGDTITGSANGSIIVGGNGADTITGGSGRNLLIGGKGNDQITGGSADDILIGGFTDYDTNFTALTAIFSVWQSNDTYANRIKRIKGTATSGTNSSYLLVNGSSVHDDGNQNVLTGNAGTDWFFKGTRDTISDLQTGEQTN